MDDLEERLRHHSATFDAMVELIPARYYIMQDDSIQYESKYWVNKKLRAPKQSVKDASKKAKRLKLDPESQKSIQELREGARRKEAGESGDESEEEEEEVKGQTGSFSVERVKSSDLNELRERLKAKVEELRQKRKAVDTEGDKVQKRQKRLDKKHRKKEMMQKEKQRKISKQVSRSSKDSRPSIEDKSGKMVYSKFDFSTPVKDWEPAGKKKDYRKLLAKAEASQRKLEELKRKDEKKGEDFQEKLNWQKAVELARGTKLRDNSKKLKKTLKRLGKKKERSQKKWEEREKQVQQSKDKRHELRQKHIQERTELIKAKKMKKRLKQKGVRRQARQPGF